VNAKGYISDSFLFGGAKGQRDRLIHEGIRVERKRVDLTRDGWDGKA
jgi:hypothetical protein